MSNRDLYTSQQNIFSGSHKTYENSKYVLFGVPFDFTSTYRTGARFGPEAIRQASLNIETISFRSGLDVENLPFHDSGDLEITSDPQKVVELIKYVVEDVIKDKKIPVAIGGEHTITLGMLMGYGKKISKTAVVSFDAHLDLRTEFSGLRLSHTTFMNLVNEQLKPAKIIEVGTRAVCKEELEYAENKGIDFLPSLLIRREGIKKTLEKLQKKLAEFSSIYISIDMDVLDPAFAPAVQNPEPDGISTSDLLDLVCGLCDERTVGLDVLEVAPIYDQGISSIVAAKILFETLCNMEKSRN